ncbi:transposase [Nonomuraea sp. NPDC050451]|uniref:transposase n=1 Tax=Nonomuraea sp. NPDC050451 TaxID=3364364 RepID=UPI0037AF0ED4
MIEAEIRVTGSDGSTTTGLYRLLTTLTDHRADPAAALVQLYHERWEIESAFFALRHTLLRGRVLRSKDPVGIEQEVWALLTLYQAVRHTMVTAVETRSGADPDRASFTIALEAARVTVTTATGILMPATGGKGDSIGHIATAVLADLLPPRRARFSARIVKAGVSRYGTWNRRADDNRPATSTDIASVEVAIQQPKPPADPQKKPQPASPVQRHRQSRPTDQAKGATPAQSRWQKAQAILQQTPERPRRAQDIAAALGITGKQNLHSFYVQMSAWARRGRLTKTAPGIYRIAHSTALDTAP